MKAELESWSFGGEHNDLATSARHPNMEKKAATLRKWYRAGQAAYRTAVDKITVLNDQLQDIPGDREREGFLMGWQSDAWAYENNKTFSVEGTCNIIPEDFNEFTYENEGHSILAETSTSH